MGAEGSWRLTRECVESPQGRGPAPTQGHRPHGEAPGQVGGRGAFIVVSMEIPVRQVQQA